MNNMTQKQSNIPWVNVPGPVQIVPDGLITWFLGGRISPSMLPFKFLLLNLSQTAGLDPTINSIMNSIHSSITVERTIEGSFEIKSKVNSFSRSNTFVFVGPTLDGSLLPCNVLPVIENMTATAIPFNQLDSGLGAAEILNNTCILVIILDTPQEYFDTHQ